jgi:hypothetical protein
MKLLPKVKGVQVRNSSPLRKANNVVPVKEVAEFDASI